MATSTITYSKGLKTLRAISHQLRINKNNVRAMPVMENFVSIVRKHDVTDRRLCRAPEELQFIGTCYQTYLESNQQYGELYRKHFGKGEKTIEEAARTVGLKLPEVPEI